MKPIALQGCDSGIAMQKVSPSHKPVSAKHCAASRYVVAGAIADCSMLQAHRLRLGLAVNRPMPDAVRDATNARSTSRHTGRRAQPHPVP